MNGGAYGTNQFSSMDVRTSEQRNQSREQADGKNHKRHEEESDTERQDDDTTSEDGRAAKGRGFRQAIDYRGGGGQPADLAATQPEYA